MKFLMIILILSSCNIPFDQKSPGKLDFEKESDEAPREVTEENNEELKVIVDFQQLKKDILEVNCLGCHRSMGDEQSLKNFITPGKPETSPLFIAVDSGRMPPFGGRLSQKKVDLVEQYILDALR